MSDPRGRLRRSSLEERRPSVVSRRRMLAGLAAGVSVLAGCVSGGDGDGRSELEDDVWRTSQYGDLDRLELGAPSGDISPLVFDVGFVRDPATGDPEYVLAERFEEDGTEVSITLREGVGWSTGDPLTAAGVGRWIRMLRTGASWLVPVPKILEGRVPPTSPLEAITAVEWDERTVTVRGEFGSVESPLFLLNEYLGRRPETYYEALWEEFQDAYDDEPWESERSRDRIRELLEGRIWEITTSDPPDAGIHLESEYEGEGWEAAYSGLWYPIEREQGILRFGVNDRHPFADRVNFEELAWTVTDNPQEPVTDLRSGAVDGGMSTDITADALAELPGDVRSIPGPAGGVTVLTLNHRHDLLAKRDVRAALQYAIDRDRLVEQMTPATREAVSVPGADLVPDRWLPTRTELRAYEHDPDRAGALLERAGFSRDEDGWITPDENPFELELLTTINDTAFEREIVADLDEFGIDADYYAVENTTYQQRMRAGYFVATSRNRPEPSAAGAERIRTADAVRRPPARPDGPRSVYLAEQLAELDATADGFEWDGESGEGIATGEIGFVDVDDLRSVTVEAPPRGEPDGDVEEWPYLYHAAMLDADIGFDEKRYHADCCAWIYNYQVPELELTIERPRIVHRTDGWRIPDDDDPVWRRVGSGTHAGGLWAALAHGRISAE